MSGPLLSACLFLLLDASGSVDAAEHRLQREATASALTSPEFLARVEYEGGIAVAVAEFSNEVTPIADWIALRSPVEAAVLAERIMTAPRVQDHSTAVGDAILYAVAQMKRAPACERPVIDVSTDGRSNVGLAVDDAVALARDAGVMVNALVIEDPTEPGLLDYYRDAVNGFALPAEWSTYEQSLKMKMTLEIAGHAPALPEPLSPYFAYYGAVVPLDAPWGGFAGYAYAPLVDLQRHDDARNPGQFQEPGRQVTEPSSLVLLAFALVGAICLARR